MASTFVLQFCRSLTKKSVLLCCTPIVARVRGTVPLFGKIISLYHLLDVSGVLYLFLANLIRCSRIVGRVRVTVPFLGKIISDWRGWVNDHCDWGGVHPISLEYLYMNGARYWWCFTITGCTRYQLLLLGSNSQIPYFLFSMEYRYTLSNKHARRITPLAKFKILLIVPTTPSVELTRDVFWTFFQDFPSEIKFMYKKILFVLYLLHTTVCRPWYTGCSFVFSKPEVDSSTIVLEDPQKNWVLPVRGEM